MRYETADDWNRAPRRQVLLFGMSGLGKTHVSNILRAGGEWFHYSVDYRIGTRYMGEHIVDNFKAEAMRNPFLARLLRSDSIYIAQNITFDNLSPLSTYLGKPGDAEKGGIPFAEYQRRQEQHRVAETAALLDTGHFIARARRLYGYAHFVCDSGGSICEVVDPSDPEDPVMRHLAEHLLPVWIEGAEEHAEKLAARFDAAPKPIYFGEPFLSELWQRYRREKGVAENAVDPDDFMRWGYRHSLTHRLPRYREMAANWGISVRAGDIGSIRDSADFNALIADSLAARRS